MSTNHDLMTKQLAATLNAVFPAVHSHSPQTEALLDKLRAWEQVGPAQKYRKVERRGGKLKVAFALAR